MARTRRLVVGDPAQQQGLRAEGLLELVVLALLSAIDLDRPTCVLETSDSARVLDDSVERNKLGYHDLAHFGSP
jgi:hypothetical protein